MLEANEHETMQHISIHLLPWVLNHPREKLVTHNTNLHHNLNYFLKLTQVGKHHILIQTVKQNLYKKMDESIFI